MKIQNLPIIWALSLLSSCAVGPNYRAHQSKAPAQWKESLAGGETNSSAATTEWWKNFNDSELDSLVGRAVRSNLDLRIAEARVCEARAQYGIASADLWPTVDGSSSYARQRQSKHQPLVDSVPLPGVPFENNVYQAGFDASWEIDVFGGKRRAKEAAASLVSASEFGRRDVLITLLGDVAREVVNHHRHRRVAAGHPEQGMLDPSGSRHPGHGAPAPQSVRSLSVATKLVLLKPSHGPHCVRSSARPSAGPALMSMRTRSPSSLVAAH